ncbi:MAG: phospholipase D-like domain-containing protein [Caldilineaceae bacterium]|nr:phospholipase D-like domain-containing protein [Caldilineaceae bacterium]
MANSSIENRVEEGLKVVTARFRKVDPFSWNLFDGFDRMRVLTYSASAQTIARMLEKYPCAHFECIFGFEEGLVADVVKAYQILNNPAGDNDIQLENEKQRVIFEGMQAGRACFYVVKKNVAHAKIYLLETNGGERRKVIVGSANFSERAFGGNQAETLVVFDNDTRAWKHYLCEYDAVKKIASDELDMSKALQAERNGDRTLIERIKQGMTTDGMEGLSDTEKWRQFRERVKRAKLKVPILKLLEYEALMPKEIEERIAAQYNLTKEERDYKKYETSPLKFFYHEIWGARDQLKKEGLVEYGGRGSREPTRITEKGSARLRTLSSR